MSALLHRVQLNPTDQIIFLGDYIDRGPASRAVIDTLMELRKSCTTVFLRGNHEVMILDARDDALKSDLWQSYGERETLMSYGGDSGQDWVRSIPASHWEFLERTERFFENDGHIFVHACLDPELDMVAQPDWLLFWATLGQMRAHKSGKRVICGHTLQRSGQINDLGCRLH